GRIVDVVGLDARIRERDRLCFGVTREEALRERERRHAADRKRCGSREKLAAVDLAVAVLVVQLDDARIQGFVRHGSLPLFVGSYSAYRDPKDGGARPSPAARRTARESAFDLRRGRRSRGAGGQRRVVARLTSICRRSACNVCSEPVKRPSGY